MSDRYELTVHTANESFYSFITQQKQQIDCLILQNCSTLPQVTNWLHGQATLLPAIILHPDSEELSVYKQDSAAEAEHSQRSPFLYHTAELHTTITQLIQTDDLVEQAIARFIHLSPSCRIQDSSDTEIIPDADVQSFLIVQQRRLADKLKERLGYLGVYYKRNSQNFFRYMSLDQKQELLEKLKIDYQNIILCYFTNDATLNQQIEDFVNTSFFTDISVPQIVEIHMDLIDDISKQLKLEGRSEEILLDYRLTLIDVIANLCEMYRRSIPRES